MTLTHESLLRASALRLRFGELWQTVADELGAGHQLLRFEYFPALAEDITHRVLAFLDAESLALASSTCRTLHEFCRRKVNAAALWTPHYLHVARYLCAVADSSTHMKRLFLKAQLLHYEAELRHYDTLRVLMKALCRMPKGTVVGVVSNIGSFDSAAVALAVSTHRQIAMQAVILSRTQDAVVFRRETGYVGPVTFFSQDNTSLMQSNAALEMPTIVADGFLGYVVNLIRLDPKEEYMRWTFILCAYKNLTVWQSDEQLAKARASGLFPAEVPAVSLSAVHEQAVAKWCHSGYFAGGTIPCFVAFARPRPRLLEPLQFRRHLAALAARRDHLRASLAHFDESYS